MRGLAVTPFLLLTCAFGSCQPRPIPPPKVVEVVVTKIVSVPAELTRPCTCADKTANTVGEAARVANSCKLATQECDARMARIRSLTP